MDKMREEMRKVSDATCDLIDAFKNFSDTIDNAIEVDPVVKEIIGNSVKETIVRILYGEDACVSKRFDYRGYYRQGRDGNYINAYDAFKHDEERTRKAEKIIFDEENEEND